MGAVRRVVGHRVFRASSLRVVALVTGVAASIVIARLGGADVKGVTSTFAAASVLAFVVVNVDLPQQVLRYGRENGNVDAVRGILLRTWPVYGGLAVVVATIGYFTDHTQWIWLAAGTTAYLASGQLGVACTGLSGPAITAIGAILQQLGLVGATLGLLAVDQLNVYWAPLAVIASFLAPLPLYAWAARPRERGPIYSSKPSFPQLLASGVRWQGARLAQLMMLRIDVLIVFSFLGAASAGIYSVGLSTATLAGLVPAQVAANTTFEAMQARLGPLRSNVLQAAATGTIGALGLALVGWPLLSVAYGPEFRESYFVLLAALPGIVAYGMLQVLTNHMRIVATARVITIPSIAGVAVLIATMVLALPWIGLVGAAVASSAGAVAAVIVGYVFSTRLPPPAPETHVGSSRATSATASAGEAAT